MSMTNYVQMESEQSSQVVEPVDDDEGFTQHVKQRKPRTGIQRPVEESPLSTGQRIKTRHDISRPDAR